MPHITRELHRRRSQWIIFWEFQLRWEHATFERRATGALDQGLPDEDVVFGDGAGSYAVRRVVGQVFVFLEETLGCDR